MHRAASAGPARIRPARGVLRAARAAGAAGGGGILLCRADGHGACAAVCARHGCGAVLHRRAADRGHGDVRQCRAALGVLHALSVQPGLCVHAGGHFQMLWPAGLGRPVHAGGARVQPALYAGAARRRARVPGDGRREGADAHAGAVRVVPAVSVLHDGAVHRRVLPRLPDDDGLWLLPPQESRKRARPRAVGAGVCGFGLYRRADQVHVRHRGDCLHDRAGV